MVIENQIERTLAARLPKGVTPPTAKDVRRAIQEGEEAIAQELERNKDKIRPLDRRALDIMINI
jgi:response regulator of citrate/malate metabolism